MPALAEPVLTFAFNNIQKLTSIDESDLQSLWGVISKCKDSLQDGRRLENISWRLWYRSCHGHFPEDDASPGLAMPVPKNSAKGSKGGHVSPDTFNRILKDAVNDSNVSARRTSGASRTTAPAETLQRPAISQTQHSIVDSTSKPSCPPSLAPASPPRQLATNRPTIPPVTRATVPRVSSAAALNALLPKALVPRVNSGAALNALLAQSQVPRVSSAAALNALIPKATVPRVNSGAALNQLMYPALARPNSGAALNQLMYPTATRLPSNGTSAAPPNGGIANTSKSTAALSQMRQYAAPHMPATLLPSTSEHPTVTQTLQQQSSSPRPRPVPHAHFRDDQIAEEEKPKVKFFISESVTPEHAPKHLVQSRLVAAAGQTPTAGLDRFAPRTSVAVVPPRFAISDSDEDECSDDSEDDFSSDLSDSDSYSDSDRDSDRDGEDDEDEPNSGKSRPPPLFQKVPLVPAGIAIAEETDTEDPSGPLKTVLSRCSLLSVAIQKTAALKRAKPSQYRNLSEMAQRDDFTTDMVDSADEDEREDVVAQGNGSGVLSGEGREDLSASLRDNLVCERRQVHMRFERSGIEPSTNAMFADDGIW
ncbi:hypothetical protein HKX48_001316 [Thoreauomyces humboldtii]|nr:hypothetical protein HKX48_001316 [Thoreauomyces humboldtii]